MSSVHRLVTEQFSPTAASYATSTVHANDEALAALVELVQPSSGDELLDVATGAGHVAHAFAPYVQRVVAYDLTRAMLDQTLAGALSKGLTNVEVVEGPAERLPFADASFDIYTVRLAPHHFEDAAAFVGEAARVLRPGGKFLLVDTISPEEPEMMDRLDEFERLRDPSHVHNYCPSEWRAMVEGAGLTIGFFDASFGERGRLIDFTEWVERMRVPAERVEILRGMLESASQPFAEMLDLHEDSGKLKFRLPEIVLLAVKGNG